MTPACTRVAPSGTSTRYSVGWILVKRSRMPRYNGVTMATSWPAAASALPSAPTMSASPPVLENGWTSLLARRIFILRKPRMDTNEHECKVALKDLPIHVYSCPFVVKA